MKTDARPSRAGAPLLRPHVVGLPGLTLLVACLLWCIFAPVPAFAQEEAAGQLGPEAQAIAQAINETRAANGLAPLRVHALLNQAAQNHVDDLIANGMYGHYGSDGSNVRTRVLRTGYPSGWVSENWVTSGSAAGAMDWWMNDWIHRVNILDASWDEVGIGAGLVSNGYYIFVTDFANADGQDTSAAAPAAAETAAEAVAVAPEYVPTEGGEYTVQGGDTLLTIGLRFGVEWQDIAVANGLGESDILSIGQVLEIPGFASSPSEDVAPGGRLYTVQPGDTLSGIAGQFTIAWEDIAAANRLGEYSVLQIGMQIRLPGVPEEDAAAEAEDAPAANDVAASAGSTDAADADAEPAAIGPAASGALDRPIVYTTELINIPNNFAPGGTGGAAGSKSYTVKPGDTLYTIGAEYRLSVKQIAEANGLSDDDLLQIGQTLLLPNIGAAAVLVPPAPPSAASAGSYVVKPGDTVISIAARSGIGWRELLDLNGLSEDSVLQVGDELKLGE